MIFASWWNPEASSRKRLTANQTYANSPGVTSGIAYGVKELFKQKFSDGIDGPLQPGGNPPGRGGADSIVRLISVADFRVIQEIPTGQKEINYVLFDPHGDWLATAGDDGTVGVWNLPSGERRAVGPSGRIR
ncbi:MAG: hypothetical protein U0872_10035 [Planctomycetaceae bacterium]